MGPDSKAEFQECIDILTNLLERYPGHTLVLCGDFNATLSLDRNNPHDKIFKEFVQHFGLVHSSQSLDEPTFIQHSGLGQSHIDYILSNKQDFLKTTVILQNAAANASAHFAIKSTFSITMNSELSKVQDISQKSTKLVWQKGDTEMYNILVQQSLSSISPNSQDDLNSKFLQTAKILQEATITTIPTKHTKLRGPRFRVSTSSLSLIKESKVALRAWRAEGSPRGQHPAYIKQKRAKKAVRRQSRREHAEDRKRFYNNLMETPDSSFFFKLIKRNRGENVNRHIATILTDERETDDPLQQRRAFARFYEDLAVPRDNDTFDNEFLDVCSTRCKLIERLSIQKQEPIVPFTHDEVREAIGSLNTNKAADEYGIAAEHIRFAQDALIIPLTCLFNEILQEGEIPEIFKTGYITPVHKKGKNDKLVENYRGITVASIFGKIFEKLLLYRLESMNDKQSELQFGFTKHTSPAMASLLVSEATLEAKSTNSPLFLGTLDSQKAFDVVNHQILLDKLYHQDVNLSVWKLVKGMYEGLTARVKWKGDFSNQFQILQGVRQGGILSTHLYKLYINDLLLDLENRSIGLHIGTTYTGCPTCADDLSLMSECSEEFGSMLNIAHTYACQHRYIIHPEKSVAVCKNKASKSKPETWKLGNEQISVEEKTVHLGLIRAKTKESKQNVTNRINIARRTLYSLINVGCHGVNGLNPVISAKIYQIYVLPRLLSGLETLYLTQTDIDELSLFHRKTLRSFQSFAQCTANSAVHLLLGILPVEPEIHKRQLGLLYSILTGENSKLLDIMDRQLIMQDENSHSFFIKVKNLLELYDLPSITNLRTTLPTKYQWKKSVKDAVHNAWTQKLKEDLENKSTMKFCNIKELKIGMVHPVWETLQACTYDVKKGIIKARMLTGTYLLPGQRSRTPDTDPTDDICQMCKLEKEDLVHLLTRCSGTIVPRSDGVRELKVLIDNELGETFWENHIKTNEDLVRLILDSSFVVENIRMKRYRDLRARIEAITRQLCYRIHMRRTSLAHPAVSVK